MSSKKRITTFNLDESLVKEFDSLCVAEDRSRSKVANRILKEFVNNKRRK